MDDFRRPPVSRIPSPQPLPPVEPVKEPLPNLELPPIDIAPQAPQQQKAKKPRRLWLWILLSVVALIIAAVATVFFVYQSFLGAVDAGNETKQPIVIVTNSTPAQIADTLKEAGLIQNQTAFLIFTRLEGVQNKLQAGSYRLSPSETTPQIVEHLTKGNTDTFDITFLPGATLADNKKVFQKAGYSDEEINKAFAASYDSPLFAGKPASADLEGYILGNTFRFGAGASVEDILKHTFDQYYAALEENGLVSAFAARGQSLFQAITIASIIQRESIGGDEPQIAQVFYSRLAIDMPLGSDVTYQYAADKEGVPRDTNLDSPYNTRRYPGLPPGPIATPGIASLKAAAAPAAGDYLFFLSGDDDVTYFARTLAEHEANIVNHCRQKCQII